MKVVKQFICFSTISSKRRIDISQNGNINQSSFLWSWWQAFLQVIDKMAKSLKIRKYHSNIIGSWGGISIFSILHVRGRLWMKIWSRCHIIFPQNVSSIHALVRVHEAKISNSQYLIKDFKEFTGYHNTPRCFGVLRDRPQVLYIFGKLVNRAIRYN